MEKINFKFRLLLIMGEDKVFLGVLFKKRLVFKKGIKVCVGIV